MSWFEKFLATGFLLLSMLILLGYFSKRSTAAGAFENLSAVVSNMTPSTENVLMSVSFSLPYDSYDMTAADYLIIELPYFIDIDETYVTMSGAYYGVPDISLVGSSVLITNIRIFHGATVTVNDISLTNPAIESLYTVNVMISEDNQGLILKNYGSTNAYTTGTQITVTASVVAWVASLQITGYASPGMLVTLAENGTVIGTVGTLPEGTGLFSKRMTGLSPGLHTFSMYGYDSYNRTTSILSFDVTLPNYVETTVSNLVLSPTIEISETSITQGDNLIVQGTSTSNGTISIFAESPLHNYTATSSAAGMWNYTIGTSTYTPGDYRIYSLVQTGGGLQSLFSNSLLFSVASTTSTGDPGTAPCDISQADLTCDSSVNLADFSVLMYYWGTNSAAADIDSNGIVNLTDFSIMMYYWG